MFVVKLTPIPAGSWRQLRDRQRNHSNSSLPPEVCSCEHATTTNPCLALAHINSRWLPEPCCCECTTTWKLCLVWDSAIPAGCRNHVVSAQQLGNRVWCGTHSNSSWLPEPFLCERTTTWKPYLVWVLSNSSWLPEPCCC